MIRLITVVGGRSDTLRAMIQHYFRLGVRAFSINLHLSSDNDPVRDDVTAITRDFGIRIETVRVGAWQSLIRPMYSASRAAHPHDWQILADSDELQEYPLDLQDLVRICEQRGFDYVRGCFLDRLAPDGTLPVIDTNRELVDQFPIGVFLSYPLAGATPRKVVLARSHVDLVQGQHRALSGSGYPIRELLVKVHHFKWIAGLQSILTVRARELESQNKPHHIESRRIVDHLAKHQGRINLTEPRFCAAPCSPAYPFWPDIQQWMALYVDCEDAFGVLQPGPVGLDRRSRSVTAVVARMLGDFERIASSS